MTEYALNQLNTAQLATLAAGAAIALAVVDRQSVKIELYYLGGHFIEISYSAKKRVDEYSAWQLYSANHYPDTPGSTKYLTFFLPHIKLSVD